MRVVASLFERAPGSIAFADGVGNATRFLFVEPPAVFEPDGGKHQWKSRKAFRDVVTNWLADLALGSDVVKQVVGNLEREAELATVHAQRGALFVLESAEQRTDIAAGRHEQRGLCLDASHVLANVSAVPIPDRLLTYLARADAHHSPGEDGHDLRRVGSRRQLIGLGEVVVPDHDR